MKQPLSEYPRPQFKRDSYYCLNGEWSYRIEKNPAIPGFFDGKVIVPFSIETEVNGSKHILQPDEYLFYKLEFFLPKGFVKDEVYLHFLAVDQIADVYLNGRTLGHHEGGFLPFSFEIKDILQDNNELIVRVRDYTDTSFYSRGKQKIKRGGMWYTPQSGIYFPVFLESVPVIHVNEIKLTPDIDNEELIINVSSIGNNGTLTIEGKKQNIECNKDVRVKIKNMHLWTTEDPYLYPITVQVGDDKVESYFAMRKFSIVKDENNIPRFALNNKPIFMNGILDQGYYKKGLLTPESYDDYIKDIELVKSLGFNTIRKHIKIEMPRWYYECDKRGVIVWQDFVNGGDTYKFSTVVFPLFTHGAVKDSHYKTFRRLNEKGRIQTREEFRQTIKYLYNSPCIALWTIFNEGWGQFDSKEILEELEKLDSTRLYDHASGWHDQGIGEIKSMHFYFQHVKFPKKDKRLKAVTEFGGITLPIEGHYQEGNAVYKKYASKEDWLKAYSKLINYEIVRNIPKGVSASIYTQLSDVEEEINGFVTFDREVIKFDPDEIKKINDLIHL